VASPAPLVLGIDLGTSALKVAAIDMTGEVAASASRPVTTLAQMPGAAEQEPADWITALSNACSDLRVALGASEADWHAAVVAIGLAGQLPTLVCGAGDEPLGRAITWKDSRADAWAAEALSHDARRRLYERTGMPIDGRYLGPMFAFHWSARAAEVEWVLSAKDYLCFVLTGTRFTDPSTAAGYGAFDSSTGTFAVDLCSRWQLPQAALPRIRPSQAAAGTLTAGAAPLLGLRAGVAVAVGSADSVAAAYAMAGLSEHTVCVTMGSSTTILDAVRERRLDPSARYLLTPHVAPGWYGREMDLLATGSGYRWLSDLFGLRDGALDERAARSPPGARGLTFTPYLGGGEQGALWNPALRGSLQGLTLEHTADDIARAFLEGVAFETRRCIELLAETAQIESVALSGPPVERAASLQLLVDVIDRPVRPCGHTSAAAIGAALCAGALAGGLQFPPRSAATDAVMPGPVSARYRELYARYRAVTG
jgi:xylulokinase